MNDVLGVMMFVSDPATYWRRQGRLEGYAPCCIEEFVLDCLAGRAPGLLRPLGADGRVLCSSCAASPLVVRGAA